MKLRSILAVALLVAVAVPTIAQEPAHPDLKLFFDVGSTDKDVAEAAMEALEDNWRDGYAPMLVEWIRFLPSGSRVEGDVLRGGGDFQMAQGDSGGGLGDSFRSDRSRFGNRRDPRVQAHERVVGFLEKMTGQDFGSETNEWRHWMWAQPYDPHPGMGVFKANLYRNIDPTFANFFPPEGTSAVRVDEVEWGGVRVNGIPPLEYPATVAASDADYLDDSNVVFGFAHNGEARAWPKRILGWHELMYDRVGGEELTVVYCTLCGTVIPYKSTIGGRQVKFGTSGLLYRSNKLMFDDITYTLWSSITGEPVVGRMVGRGVRLVAMPVVTTTWGEWKSQHPETTVLSIDTGHERDYSEGAAYSWYFETDDLMFQVSQSDNRLANKAEVLAIRFPRPSGGDDALAISADFLSANPVYQTNFAGRELVIVTSPDGANRVYPAPGIKFVEAAGDNQVRDDSGRVWEAQEDMIFPVDAPEEGLPRLVAFRAFWFGWYAQYPETELITN